MIVVQIVEIKDNPFWEYDVDKAIDNFKAMYGIRPHMIIGEKFIEQVAPLHNWITKEPIDKSKYIIGKYKGTLCEYDPDISCVILKG